MENGEKEIDYRLLLKKIYVLGYRSGRDRPFELWQSFFAERNRKAADHFQRDL